MSIYCTFKNKVYTGNWTKESRGKMLRRLSNLFLIAFSDSSLKTQTATPNFFLSSRLFVFPRVLAMNRGISTGPLARPFAPSLKPLTHALTPPCSLCSHIRSLACSLTHSRAHGKRDRLDVSKQPNFVPRCFVLMLLLFPT